MCAHARKTYTYPTGALIHGCISETKRYGNQYPPYLLDQETKLCSPTVGFQARALVQAAAQYTYIKAKKKADEGSRAKKEKN